MLVCIKPHKTIVTWSCCFAIMFKKSDRNFFSDNITVYLLHVPSFLLFVWGFS